MSAIVGIYRASGEPVAPPELDRMLVSVEHRGRDGSGAWLDGSVGLGHRMLWTTPESLGEKLPAAAAELVITADARIDNRDELLQALELAGAAHRTLPDSELILMAYRCWGEACVDHLLGDFAFAIWDGRRQRLFCARDHLGAKPFYYYQGSQRLFVFGSEIKALLALPEVPRRVNEARVASYLVRDYHDTTSTYYEGILRLPASHWMTVGRDGLVLQRYWELNPSRQLRLGSDAEYADAFRERFVEAVRCRLRTPYPVGSFLSGGLDSSGLVCVARKLLADKGRGPLHTFGARFEGFPEADDVPYADAVVRQGGLDAHDVQPDHISPLAHVPELVRQWDAPFENAQSSVTWVLRRLAHEQGVRVLLDGSGGDLTLCYDPIYLAELARSGHWIELLSEASGWARNYWAGRHSTWRVLRRRVIAPLLPAGIRDLLLRLRDGGPPALQGSELVHPGLARRVGLHARREADHAQRWAVRTFHEAHYRALTDLMVPYGLEALAAAAGAFAFEPRFPFFDRRVVEFCLALPREQLVSRGMTRFIVRRALADHLPKEVLWRGTKADNNRVATRSLLRLERDLLDSFVDREAQILEDYVDLDRLRQIFARFRREGAVEGLYSIWLVVNLACWLRTAGVTREQTWEPEGLAFGPRSAG